MTRRAAAALALALAGCSILPPRPDPSRFFTLSAVTRDGAAPEAATGLALGLGPVRVPAYLDRPELATRVAPNELRFSATERWAEPLGTSLRRVLAQNLDAELGPAEITFFPWPAGTELDWAVAVDVRRFERTPAGEVEIAARWVVRDPATGRIRLARESRVTRHTAGEDTDAVVAAWNEALAELSHEIATAVRALPRNGAAPE